MSAEYEDGGWDRSRGNSRGRGRGRGRGFRGRGRGGYNGPQVDGYQDGGYIQEAPIQGRGKCKNIVVTAVLYELRVEREIAHNVY